MPIRGLVVDAARLPELPSTYIRLIDFCSDWGFNALLFRLTDDQGCALRFESHPELLHHPHALSAGQMRELVACAAQRGVEVIPEIESFGHSQYITSVPPHRELSDEDPKATSGFSGLNPVHPRTLPLLADLYREAASVFPSRFLHGGCDEVNWGGSELSRAALRTRSRAQIWADHLNGLNRIARSLGKELIVWGDHVLRNEPETRELLSKDIIIHDWDYWTTDAASIEQVARKALDQGFRILGGPALMWCRWGPRPHRSQLDNVDAYADTYLKLTDPHNLGVIVTNWLPSRYLPGALWDCFAYAAVALQEGGAVARREAFRRFAERHYGVQWSAAWEELFTAAYEAAPWRGICSPPAGSKPELIEPWRNDQSLLAVLKRGTELGPSFARLRELLRSCEGEVRRNRDDFRDLALTFEYLEHLYWREAAIVSAKDTAAAHKAVGTIAERDRRLCESLATSWHRARLRSDSPDPANVADYMPADNLLDHFRQAAAYSANLARNLGELRLVIQEARACQSIAAVAAKIP